MFAFRGALPTATWGRLLALAGVLALIGLASWIPPSAHASSCENSWTDTAGGSWFVASNWSKKAVPATGEEVCIAANGTYTVEMTQTGTTGSVSVKALTIGGTEGAQTVVVTSTSSLSATLATTSGLTVGAHGALTLTSNAGTSTTVEGSVSNGGTLTSEGSGTRQLQGNLTNTHTVNINTETKYNGTSTALKNEGALNVADKTFLVVFNESSITNGTGGSITGTGSGAVFMEPKTSFTEGAGTTSGTKPVIVDDAVLTYGGAGASTITSRGESSTLSGASSSGQSLVIEGTCSENAKTTASSSFTNAGAITLTTSCGTAATLAVTSGTLANSGTLTSEGTGTRQLVGNLTNTGTVNISTSTRYNGAKAALKNEGALTVADKTFFEVSNEGSVTNASGGKIAGTGSGAVFMEPKTSFTEGAGTTSGTKPVIVDDAVLTYSGAGASTITSRGESSTLSGASSSGQSLVIEGTCTENAITTASSSFTNAGAITLTTSCGTAATLAVTSGTLANSGMITSEPASGGGRALQGNITSTGTLAINATTSDAVTGATITNAGAINVANEKLLIVTKGSLTNSGGNIAGAGSGAVFFEPGGSVTEGAGTTSGAKPVIVDDGTLTYSGKGASTITTRGESSTLSGAPSAGQALVIEGTCSENAKTTAASGVTNGGSITLTSNCGTSATLNPSGGTLENKGTVASEVAGGLRQIEGNLKNEKNVSAGAGTVLKVSGTYSQGKKATLTTTIASPSSFGALSAGGTATLSGTLALVQGFKAAKGEKFAILSSSALSGKFAKLKNNKIAKSKPPLKYNAIYSGTGVTLEVSK